VILAFSFLAFLWMTAAYGALGGRSSYPFADAPPCGDALRDQALGARMVLVVPALLAFGGAAGAAWILVARLSRTHAARRAMRDVALLVILSFVPLIGGFTVIALPYVFALNTRAGHERVPVVRWLTFAVGVAVATLASSYWLDAFGCL